MIIIKYPKLQQNGTGFLLSTKLIGAITVGQSNVMLFHLEWLIIAIHCRVLYTYAPFTDQPKLDRIVDEIPEVSKACVYVVHACACVCVCAHVCVHVCVYIHVYVCVPVCVYCKQICCFLHT